MFFPGCGKALVPENIGDATYVFRKYVNQYLVKYFSCVLFK